MLNPDAKKFCKFTHLFTRRKQSPNFLQNFSTGSKPLMQEPDAIGCKNISKYYYCPIYPEMVLSSRYESFAILRRIMETLPNIQHFCKTSQQDVNILSKPIWYKYQHLSSYKETFPLTNRPVDFRKAGVLQI